MDISVDHTRSKAGGHPTTPIAIVKVGGYIEFSTSDEMDKVLDGLVTGGHFNIIVDLRDVDYISSRGWTIFLSKIKAIRDNHGDLKLANMNENVYEVYKVLEFFWILRVYDSLKEAVADFDDKVPPMPQ